MNLVKALFFDVFGTLADWRNGVARESEKVLAPLGYKLDWLEFADAWRNEYQVGMEEVRSGRQPFAKLDIVHRRNLDRILPRFNIKTEEAVLKDLNLVWHRIDAWPEVPAALARLKKKFILAPVSNGNISMMVALARKNAFPWDAILGGEVAHDYKPKPRVYLTACEALDLEPSACMMVAAHSYDLSAASALGLKTAHIARPQEAPGKGEAAPSVPVDVVGQSLGEIADKLGA